MIQSLLVATGNHGKFIEIKSILSSFTFSLISIHNLNLHLKVEETGSSYSENAKIKALAYLGASGLPTLADDSGLEVDALGGEPGIQSARFSPKANATDSDRRAYLLEQLRNLPQPWSARFHCTAILALPGGKFIETSGQCEGEIIPTDRGTGGFGYDPVFYVPEYEATMAELPVELKNKISHRAKALQAMFPYLYEYLEKTC